MIWDSDLVTRFNLHFICIGLFFKKNIILVIHEKIIISSLKIRFVYRKILILIPVKRKLVILVIHKKIQNEPEKYNF
jgi:hypothetical protein